MIRKHVSKILEEAAFRAFLPLFLVIPALPGAAGCYMKSVSGGDAASDGLCDLEGVTIEITETPLPYIEEQTNCPHPVYMTLEYKVTNNTARTITLDALKLEGIIKATGEEFFDWDYVDANHHTLEAGRNYTVRLDGILVGAVILHVPGLQLADGVNSIRTTLSYNAGGDSSCGGFDVSDGADLRAATRTDVCP